MSRLEKKCFVASASAHSLLFLLLALAPVLLVNKTPLITSRPPLLMIPSRLIDGASGGGGSPTAREMPAPAPARPVPLTVLPPPTPAPPKPQPTAPAPEPAVAKEPVEAAPKIHVLKSHEVFHKDTQMPTEESDAPVDTKPSKKKSRVEISLVRDNTYSQEKAAADARARAEASTRAAQARFSSGLSKALSAINQGASSSTSFEVPGPGGEAYADYGQAVQTIYYSNWSPPSDLADDLATVTARVVILRSGIVESFKVIKTSGHGALDKSVDRLKSLRMIAPFPEGAPDEKRTFLIVFNLHANR